MKRISLECPICGKSKFQKLPSGLVKKRKEFKKGIVGILIPEKKICDHKFVVYIDKNFNLRDVLSADEIKDMNKQKFINVDTIENMVSQLSKASVSNILKKL
jgi:hypothetical protein